MPDTPPPSSDPTRSELPEEIGAAIESLIGEAKYEGGRFSSSDGADIDRCRATLTAAILARLTAAEAERDEAAKELAGLRSMIKRSGIEDEMQDRLLGRPGATAAALARVERMEKALEVLLAGIAIDGRPYSPDDPPEPGLEDRLLTDPHAEQIIDYFGIRPTVGLLDLCRRIAAAREALAPAPSEGDRR